MKLIKILLFLFAFILLASLFLNAQTIQLQMDSSPSPYLSDWEFIRETAILIVSNSSMEDIEAKISSQLYRGTSDLIAETDLSDMPIQYFPPGVSTYYPEDLVPFDAIDVHDGSIEDSVIRTGMIPADTYTLCINLVDPYSFQPLVDEPACQTFLITSYQPPILIQPVNNEEIILTGAPQITFRWTPVVPAPEGMINYKVTVFEIMEGQYPEEAFQANMAIIEEYVTGMIQMIWPPYYPLPEVPMSYVWAVQALDDQDRPIGEPEGRSELFTFQVSRIGRNPQIGSTMSLAINLDPQPLGMLNVLGKNYFLLKPLDKDDKIAEALIFGKTSQPGNTPGDLPEMEKVEVEKFQYKEQFGQSGRSRIRNGSGPIHGLMIYTNLHSSINNPYYQENDMSGEMPDDKMAEGDPIPGIDLKEITWIEAPMINNPLYEESGNSGTNPMYDEEGLVNEENPLAVDQMEWIESAADDHMKSDIGPLKWMAPEMLKSSSSGKKGYDYYLAKADMNKAMYFSKKGYDYYKASSDAAAVNISVKVKFKAGSELSKKVNAWDPPPILLYNMRTAELQDVENMDDTGEFWFTDLPPGEYAIIIDYETVDDIIGFTVTNLGEEIAIDGSELYLSVVYHGDALKDIFALEDLNYLDPDSDNDGLRSGDDPLLRKKPGRTKYKTSNSDALDEDSDDDYFDDDTDDDDTPNSNLMSESEGEPLPGSVQTDGSRIRNGSGPIHDELSEGDPIPGMGYQDGDDPLLRKRPGRIKYGNITLERVNNNNLIENIMLSSSTGRDKVEIVLNGFINSARYYNKRKFAEEMLEQRKVEVSYVSESDKNNSKGKKEWYGHINVIRAFDSDGNITDEWTPVLQLHPDPDGVKKYNRRPLDPATVTENNLTIPQGDELAMNKAELIDTIASSADLPTADVELIIEQIIMNLPVILDEVEYLTSSGLRVIVYGATEGQGQDRFSSDVTDEDNSPSTTDTFRMRPIDGKNEAGDWKATGSQALDDDDDGDSIPAEIELSYRGKNTRKNLSVIALQLPGIDNADYDITAKAGYFYVEGSQSDSRSPYAIESRDQLKTYFETGDIPTEDQFGTWFDSNIIYLTEPDAENSSLVQPLEYSPEVDDEVLIIFGNEVVKIRKQSGEGITGQTRRRGDVKIEDISITKELDKSSPMLMGDSGNDGSGMERTKGETTLGDVVVTKELDKSSPKLMGEPGDDGSGMERTKGETKLGDVVITKELDKSSPMLSQEPGDEDGEGPNALDEIGRYNEGWNLYETTDSKGNPINFALSREQDPKVQVRGWDMYYIVSEEDYKSGNSNALKARHDAMMAVIRNMK